MQYAILSIDVQGDIRRLFRVTLVPSDPTRPFELMDYPNLLKRHVDRC